MAQSNEDFELLDETEPLPSQFAGDELSEETELEAADLNEEADPSEEPTTAPEAFQLPPDKKYFRIGEAADLLGVEPHVLR